MKLSKMLPDDPWNAAEGVTIERRYSVHHLLFHNPLAQATDAELVQLLRNRIATMAADPTREGPFNVAVDLLNNSRGGIEPKAVAQIIHQGNFYGLGASPLVSLESALLWAAAARLLCRACVQHVNDLNEVRRSSADH